MIAAYGHSQYSNGASCFNGSGFVSFSQPPPFSITQNAADPSPLKKKGSPKSTGVLPLTVKQASQVLQRPFDDTFTLYGVDINIVTLVGMLTEKVENTTDVSFVLDDGTGRVDVKCWVDGQDVHACKEILTVQNGSYVRIHGHLRCFHEQRSIVAISIRSIVDFNEVTFHFLESIYVVVFNLKCMGHAESSNLIGGVVSNFMQPPVVSPAYNGFMDKGGASPGIFAHEYNPSFPVNTAGAKFSEACVKRLQSIFEEPRNLSLEAGLHVGEIMRRMTGFGRQEVRDAIEFLVNEGRIYSTIDEDHYRSTNG